VYNLKLIPEDYEYKQAEFFRIFAALRGLRIAEHRYLRSCMYVGIFVAQEPVYKPSSLQHHNLFAYRKWRADVLNGHES
jgi:hypothetical protein